jgi:hypothetical protein
MFELISRLRAAFSLRGPASAASGFVQVFGRRHDERRQSRHSIARTQ